MNFAEARCWPLPCLWVQQGAQNLCITSMLIVDLTHALEHVNPCNLGTATFKNDQFLRHSETLKPVALSLLISSWPLKHLKPIKPLARWQHFWRSSAEPKPAAWQVQRGSGNTAKDRNSRKHTAEHSTVFSDIYPRRWLKRTLLPSSWLGFLALIVELLPATSTTLFLHVPCVGSMSHCSMQVCASRDPELYKTEGNRWDPWRRGRPRFLCFLWALLGTLERRQTSCCWGSHMLVQIVSDLQGPNGSKRCLTKSKAVRQKNTSKFSAAPADRHSNRQSTCTCTRNAQTCSDEVTTCKPPYLYTEDCVHASSRTALCGSLPGACLLDWPFPMAKRCFEASQTASSLVLQMCLVLHRAKQVMFQIASNTSGGSRTGTPQVHLPTESDELEERPGALHPALMTLGSFRVLAQVTHHTSATCCIRSLRPLACRPRVFHPWQKLRANPTSFHAPASTMSPEPNWSQWHGLQLPSPMKPSAGSLAYQGHSLVMSCYGQLCCQLCSSPPCKRPSLLLHLRLTCHVPCVLVLLDLCLPFWLTLLRAPAETMARSNLSRRTKSCFLKPSKW